MAELLDEAWGWLVGKLLEWALSTFQTLLLWWMSDTAYNVRLNGEQNGVLYGLREHLNWLTATMALAGFFVAAARIAVQRKGEPFRVALSQFVELAIIVLTLAAAVNLANIAADRYSIWILEDMMPEGDFEDAWGDGIDVLGAHENDTSFILAVFALFGAMSTVIQFCLMLFRSGVIIILVGILPTVAASRFSSYGDAAYRKCIHWLISFILFKPVAATIYAAALKLMSSPSEADRLFGLALIAGAVFALPATMRAVMPAVAENNSSFGIRQVGHFAFGSTAVNAGKRTGVWTGLTGIGGGGPRPGPSGGGGGGAPGGSADGGQSGGPGGGLVPLGGGGQGDGQGPQGGGQGDDQGPQGSGGQGGGQGPQGGGGQGDDQGPQGSGGQGGGQGPQGGGGPGGQSGGRGAPPNPTSNVPPYNPPPFQPPGEGSGASGSGGNSGSPSGNS